MWSVLGAVAPGMFAFAWYVATLGASIPGGDSGELVAEACRLGHAHPPGYPLFTMVYHAVMERAPFVKMGVPLPAWAAASSNSPSDDFGSGAIGRAERSALAWKANLLTAVFGGVAVCFIQAAACGVSSVRFGQLGACLSGALLAAGYGLSELTWQYAIGAEVFALNNFLVAVLVWLVVLYGASDNAAARGRVVDMGAFWSGLALCNQHTVILFEVPLIGWVMWHEWRQGEGVGIARLVRWGTFFALGLTPYAYLPVAQTYNRQPGSWGDSTSVAGFVHHLRRGDYGTFRLFAQDKDIKVGMVGRIGLYFEDLMTRQGTIGVLFLTVIGSLALVFPSEKPASEDGANNGVAVAVKKKCSFAASNKKGSKSKKESSTTSGKIEKRKTKEEAKAALMAASASTASAAANLSRRRSAARALVGAFGFYLFVFHCLSNMPLDQELLFGIQARFWMQPNLLAFLFAAHGLCLSADFVAGLLFPLDSSHKTRVNKNSSVGLFTKLLVISAAGLLLVARQVSRNAWLLDQSSNFYFERYARALLAALPRRSLLVVGYDQQWTSLRYVQQCLGVRPDVVVVDGPMLTYTWLDSYHSVYTRDAVRCLEFPGTHWAQTGSVEHLESGGYTTLDFLNHNMANCTGGVYHSGKLNFNTLDRLWEKDYAVVNIGMVKEIVPRRSRSKSTVGTNANANVDSSSYDEAIEQFGTNQWIARCVSAWREVHKQLPDFPPAEKYSAETWEWTLARDYTDHMFPDSANLLSIAIERDSLYLMAYAAFLGERALDISGRNLTAAANVKNLGLAYVKMVQSKSKTGFNNAPSWFPGSKTAHLEALFGDAWKSDEWRNTAAMRAFTHWSMFAEMDSAKEDPAYATILNVLDVLKSSVLEKKQVE